MTTTDSLEQRCTYHPDVTTRLRCSRCGTPICPRCMVSTPVGFRCPDCARGPRPAIYQASGGVLVKAIVTGVVIAVAAGAIWGLFPRWQFYCALLLGFGVAEGIAWVTKYKRGPELRAVAMSCVLLGIVVSRLVIAWDSPFLTLDLLLNQPDAPGVREAFQLRFIPDFLFMAIPFGINWVRFR